MLTRVMNVFYDEMGYPFKDKERSVRYPLIGSAFMGASNTTAIRFYIDRIGGNLATWVANGKLANGKMGHQVLESAYDEELHENYVTFTLSAFFTQVKGDLTISLAGYNGGLSYTEIGEGIYEINGTPVIQTTGSIKINIAYATGLIDEEEDQFTFNDFFTLLSQKLDTKLGIVVVEYKGDIEDNIDNYEFGQMFFCLEDESFYKIDDLGVSLVYDLNAYRDRVGLIKRSGILDTTHLLTIPQLIEAKKQFCIMLYTGVSPREMYIKASGVSSGETETTIKFVKVDDNAFKQDNGYQWVYHYKSLTFDAISGLLTTIVDNTITSYTKSGIDYAFANLFKENVFSYSPQTNEQITDASDDTKLTTKKYVKDLMNEHLGDYNLLEGRVDDIEEKIPSQASDTNQLADKDFVNSTVNSLVAFYITKNAQGDPFATYSELASATTFYSGGQVRVPTRNDYCLVVSDENHDNASCRYIYQGNQWEFQFVVNETPFTSDQLKAINSGITDTLVAQITANANNITTINGKLPIVKDFAIPTSAWTLVDGKYVAELSAGVDFVIDDNFVKLYTPTSANDNLLVMSYGIMATSDSTTQKFTFTCNIGDTVPDEIVNYTITMFGGN